VREHRRALGVDVLEEDAVPCAALANSKPKFDADTRPTVIPMMRDTRSRIGG
jgi:hypothetical protein